MANDPYDTGLLRARPKKEQPQEDEPKNKAEVLAVTWGLTQGDPAAYREAAIWWLLSVNEADRLKGVIDPWGQRHKEAVGPARDPWNGTYKAVLELERFGINTLAAIVRRYIAGEKPSPEVQAELDYIISVNGRPGA
jgi:hypothetical protein